MKWKTPPRSGAGRGRTLQVEKDVAVLRKNPGQWAVVVERAKSAAPVNTYKSRGCVATSHRVNTSPDRFDIYAMWPADETPDVKGDDALVDVLGDTGCE